MKFRLNTKELNFIQNSEVWGRTTTTRTSNRYIVGFYIFQNFRFFFSKYSRYIRNMQILSSFVIPNLQALKIYAIRFYLKGIGYKFLQAKKFKAFLKIELGYSVSTYIKIPTFVKIFHKRDKLVMLGMDKVEVINFSKQIFSLRPADAYKGKGVRLSTLPYTIFKAGKQR